MKKQLFVILWFVGLTFVTQQVFATSSISTRVKVVEEKIRLHDKKLRELSARQEMTNRQVETLKQAKLEADKAVEAKAEANRKAAYARAAAAKAQALAAQEKEVAKTKKPALALHSDPAHYAFP